MKNMQYQDLVKDIFSFIATLGPTFKKHVDEHMTELAPIWLSSIKDFDMSVCKHAFNQFKKINITRFPQVGFFLDIVKQSILVVKKDDGLFLGTYKANIHTLQNFKNMPHKKTTEILSRIHEMQSHHPEWQMQVSSDLRDLIWFAELYLRLGIDSFEKVQLAYAKGVVVAKKMDISNDEQTPNSIHATNDSARNQPQKLQAFL